MKPIEIDAEVFNDMKNALRVALEMRAAQKAYFKGPRTKERLLESKRLETALDTRLATLKGQGL